MAYDNPGIQDFKDYYVRDFPYSSDPSLGATDADIAKAYGQTNFNINPDLWTQTEYTIAYLLLAAHYLCIDLRMGSQGIYGQYNWVTTNKSVGNVSEGFQVPQQIMDNPLLAMYSKTNYGAKYLELLLPRLVGPGVVVAGSTRP